MDKRKASILEMKGNAFIYGNSLIEAFKTLPAYPPENFLNKDYLVMKSLAISIVRKLRFFLTDIEFDFIKNIPDMRDHRYSPDQKLEAGKKLSDYIQDKKSENKINKKRRNK